MIIATIKKLDGTHLDHGKFASEEEALTWFQPRIDQGIYGQKHVPAIEIQEQRDEDGNLIVAASSQPEIPAAFSIEFAEDVVSQEQINAEALKYLHDTDWLIIREADTGEPCPSDIKQARAEARLRIV